MELELDVVEAQTVNGVGKRELKGGVQVLNNTTVRGRSVKCKGFKIKATKKKYFIYTAGICGICCLDVTTRSPRR